MLRRKRLLVLLAFLGLVGIGWANRPRDEPSRVTPEEAVRSFRAESGSGASGSPLFGVYRYSTKGSESVDLGLLATTHDYGGVSTITLSPGSCGTIERWQVLQGRWWETESCPGTKALELRRVIEFHEFFGSAKEDTFRCRGATVSDPPLVRVDSRFASICSSKGSSFVSSSRIVDLESMEVKSIRFPAVRTFSQISLEGDTVGRARIEDWRRRSDGVLLKRVVSSTADTGEGEYTESYELELLDPQPQR